MSIHKAILLSYQYLLAECLFIEINYIVQDNQFDPSSLYQGIYTISKGSGACLFALSSTPLIYLSPHTFSNISLFYDLLPRSPSPRHKMPSTKPTDSFRVVKTGKTLQAFASNLEKALKTSLSSSGKPYDRVSVLAFHWANDDMGVDKLESELLDVFRNTYGFETESWTIPVVGDPESELAMKLVDWTRDHKGERALRIYIYSGHANSHGTVDDKWYFG